MNRITSRLSSRLMLGTLAVAMALGVIGVVLARAPATNAGAGARQPQHASGATVPDEVLVKFAHSSPKADRHSAHEAAHADSVQSIDALDTERVHVRPGTTVEQAIAAYKGRGDVVYAEPNGEVQPTLSPNDPMFNTVFNGQLEQWGLVKVSAPAAWDITTGSSSVTVADLDTGIDLTHPEFAGRIIPGVNTVLGNADITDDNGHGTHTAGIIGANTNNGIGVAGVSWLSPLLVVKVLQNSTGTDASVAGGIVYATDHGARVINLSLGGSGSQTMQDGVQYALSHNVVVVAGAGNDSSDTLRCPACYSNLGVIAVAGTDSNDQKMAMSSYGTKVSIAAPGMGIWSTYPGIGYASLNGTSMSTPFVSGAAALLLAVHPTWSNTQVRDQLVRTADPINSPYFSAGRLNIAAALSAAPPPAPSATATPIASPTPLPSPTAASGDAVPPSVAISQPSGGATVPAGKTIAITASAADNVGVKKVEFYLNGVLKCTDTSAPYSCNWGVSRTLGVTYAIEARAYDGAGNRASQSISVVSGLDVTPPTVGITSPIGSVITLAVGTTVTLSATAFDDVGVKKVEFWVNGSRKCSDGTWPYACNWTVPSTPGVSYIIEARAYDVSGNVTRQSVTAVSQ